jgi:hypothetical protein
MQFNHFQKKIMHMQHGINKQLVKLSKQLSLHSEATAHRQLISLHLFATGTGHVSDYKMQF